ncbi:TRAP transporter small permease [Orrella sp. JC864]|uniref:TRAP transporter small permease n=1 Tax=Orrella sp. JC864 TaxID=3120298 RepID=UPI0012BCAA8D
MSVLRLLDRGLFRGVSILAQLLLVAAVAAGFFQVLARFVLQSPADWTEVLTRALLIWTVMLGISLALREGAMIAVDVLRSVLRARGQRVLELLVALVCAGFLGFLAWIGGQMTWRVRFQNVPSLDIPISWIYVAIPIGAALGAIAVLARWLAGPDQPAPVRNDAQG